MSALPILMRTSASASDGVISFARIRQLALEVGFDDVGVAQADYLVEEARYLEEWLSEGKNGSMGYMERNLEKRLDPRLLVPGTQTIVSCVLSYYKQDHQPKGAPYVAMSGLSARDYHEVVKEKLMALERRLVEEYTDEIVDSELQHVFCDSAPVLERAWARRAGLGVIGKNRQFLHPQFGSYVHLGELFLTVKVEKEVSRAATSFNPCQDCNKCLVACPTNAIQEDGMDARRCVSYLTIERREPMPEEHKGKPYIGLYGCDNCQKVCPVNKGLQANLHEELAANPVLLEMTQEDWQATSKRQRVKLLRRQAD